MVDSICGYYPYSLVDLFPRDKSSLTNQWEKIKQQFFD